MKIILIGGVPRTGKTTLAKKIASDFGISWMSTDALESIAHQYTPTKERATLFPKSVMRRKTNRNNDEFYSTYSISEIIDSYDKQAETVSNAIEALTEYADKEGWGYVIEGYHVTPLLLAKLRDKKIDFSSVVLVNTDPKEAIVRSRKSGVKNDWVRDNTQNEDTFQKIANLISAYSSRLSSEANERGIQVVDMGSDFESKLTEVYESLIK